MIQIEGLVKRYQDVTALDGLNLRVQKGRFFVLLGPNGAGKTTALKILAGLLAPSAGRVRIGGHDWSHPSPEARRRVTYIPDFPYLYDKLTPREFLEFVAAVYALPSQGMGDRIQFWMDTLELIGQQDKLIEQLSHGQRQRLVFASAFLPSPELILVDEPMVGLDPRMRQKVSRLMKEMTRAGTTVFLSTHTLSLAEEMADEIAILDKGKCVACGTLGILRERAGTRGKIEEIFFKLTEEADDDPRTAPYQGPNRQE